LKPTAPRCGTLTTARLDREAGLDRDLSAVATALHHDAGFLVGVAIARARATFRPGERPCGHGGIGLSPSRRTGPAFRGIWGF